MRKLIAAYGVRWFCNLLIPHSVRLQVMRQPTEVSPRRAEKPTGAFRRMKHR